MTASGRIGTGGRGRGGRAARLLTLVALCLAAPSAPAAADEPAAPSAEDLAAARQIFNEGKALEKKKDWAEALKRFRRVAAVKMTPQVRFHLALCQEHLGRLVEALNGFELAYEEARRTGRGAEEVLELARARAQALRQRVSALRLTVRGTLRTSRVLIDDNPVPPALFGTEIPLDPGAHVVTVQRDREVIFSKSIELPPRGRDALEITVDDPEAPPEPDNPSPEVKAPPPPPPPSRAPAYLAGAVGLGALAGAGVFFALRESAFGDVRATCSGEGQTKGCDPAMRDRFEQGKTYTTAAAVLGGVGVVGLASAGVLWVALTPGDATPAQTSVRLAPTLGGVRVLGSF